MYGWESWDWHAPSLVRCSIRRQDIFFCFLFFVFFCSDGPERRSTPQLDPFPSQTVSKSSGTTGADFSKHLNDEHENDVFMKKEKKRYPNSKDRKMGKNSCKISLRFMP